MSKVKKFNFKYLKDQASAGSFRRGYECYTNNCILESRVEKNFYHAKVKGNYQDSYQTDLIFKKNAVEARCTCPLKEEWCKHSIAVAIKAIKENAYEKFLFNKFEIQPDLQDEDTELTSPAKGDYVFHFNNKRKPNFFSILIISRQTGKVV